jgi:hypothetical protein
MPTRIEPTLRFVVVGITLTVFVAARKASLAWTRFLT